MRQTTQFIVGQIRLMQTVLPGLDEEARRAEERDVGEPGLQLVPPYRSIRRVSGLPTTSRSALETSSANRSYCATTGDVAPVVCGSASWPVLEPLVACTAAAALKAPALPHDLWLWLAATLATLMLIAGLFVRGIARPLANAAVDAIGDGSTRRVERGRPKSVALRCSTTR